MDSIDKESKMYIELDMDDRQLLEEEQAQFEAYMDMNDEEYQIELETQQFKEQIKLLISEFGTNFLQIYGRFHTRDLKRFEFQEHIEGLIQMAFNDILKEMQNDKEIRHGKI
jgi:hypothetical protein